MMSDWIKLFLVVIDLTYRDRYGHSFSLNGLTFSITFVTWIFDVHSRALAISACWTHNEGPCADCFHSGSITILTFSGLRARLTPRSATFKTSIYDVHVNILVYSSGGLCKCQVHDNFLSCTKSVFRLGKIIKSSSLEALFTEYFPKQLFGINSRSILPVLRESLRTESGTRSESTAFPSHLLWSLSVRVILLSSSVVAQDLKWIITVNLT